MGCLLGAAVCLFNIGVHAQGVIAPIICDISLAGRYRGHPLPNALPVKSIISTPRSTVRWQRLTSNRYFATTRSTRSRAHISFQYRKTHRRRIAIWENGVSERWRSREEARRIYDEIVRRQKDPGLPNMVRTSFRHQYSIPPNPIRNWS